MIAMETDLNKIKKLSMKKEDENWEFRSFLKRCDVPSEEIDSIVHRLYQRVSSEMDCKTCANCCKEVQLVLVFEDIEKLSKGLGISISQFKNQYLVKDSESENHIFNMKPCPFLKANLCSCYAYRPEDCRSYPHLHKPDFVLRLINVIGNCSICPVVFNVYERLKNEMLTVSRMYR
jgi:Fe-S-cluster containining protein